MTASGTPENWENREYIKDRDPATRLCSQCKEPMESRGKGHRICSECKKKQVDYYYKAVPSCSGRREDKVNKGM